MSNLFDIMRSLGRSDALALRSNVTNMTGTQIIASEYCIPPWDSTKDYSKWCKDAPVTDEDQVWQLIQPHDASAYEGRPSTLRALWGLVHTTDPKKAKSWVDPFGTSGMYMKNECYKDSDGGVFRCKNDSTIHDAVQFPEGWDVIIL